jgi:chorismate mutase
MRLMNNKVQLIAILSITFFFQTSSHAENNQQEGLQVYRAEIDKLDAQLIQILGERMKVVAAVGRYKASHNLPVLQSKRFEEIVQKNIQLGQQAQISEAFIKAIMNAIHEESLAKENNIVKAK